MAIEGPAKTSITPVRVDLTHAGGQAERAVRIGERLRAELRSLIEAFPPEHRTIAAMSRWLGVSRPVCQRVLACVRHRGDPLGAMEQLPGVQGLGAFVAAARGRKVSADAVRPAEAAVTLYASLIDEEGGSQSRLVRALDGWRRELEAAGGSGAAALVPPASADGGRVLEGRRLAFSGARAVTRREFESHIGAWIVAPSRERDGCLDSLSTLGLIGIKCDAGAMPICPVGTFGTVTPAAPLSAPEMTPVRTEEPGYLLPVSALERFCSASMPPLVARRRGRRMPVLIDPIDREAGPIDVVLTTQVRDVPHPREKDPPIELCNVLSDGPSRRLTMTAYLHRSLAAECVASAGVFAKQPVGFSGSGPAGDSPLDRWYDRLPDPPALEYLGTGIERAATPAYARMSELMAYLFEIAGWSPDLFVGYRCEVEYPMWNTNHIVWFDFTPAEEE